MAKNTERDYLHTILLKVEDEQLNVKRIECLADLFYTGYIESRPVSLYEHEINGEQLALDMREHLDNAALIFAMIQEKITMLYDNLEKMMEEIMETKKEGEPEK